MKACGMQEKSHPRARTGSSFQAILKASFAAPESHELPWYAIWGITILVPFLVACINYAMVMADVFLVTTKFDLTQEAATHGAGDACLVLMGICAFLALGAACLVLFVAPICAGSGIPEAKGYLNGNMVPGMFKVPNFFVRTLGIVLATSAGFPIGREGPMVCIGGCVGIGVAYLLASPFMKKWVKVDSETSALQQSQETVAALLVLEERFAYVLRMGCVLGGAAGIATAFNAPIGAILYMFEEVTVTAWSIEFTFRCFVCTTLATYGSKLLLDMSGSDVHRLLIYQEGLHSARDWTWLDVPFFVLLAVLVGMTSAFFTRALLKVWDFRKKFTTYMQEEWSWKKTTFTRLLEVVLYAAFCAGVLALIPSVIPCVHSTSSGHGEADGHAADAGVQDDHGATAGSDGHHRRLSALSYVQYTCPEGSHNELATLVLSGAEGAVKHLFSRDLHGLALTPMVVALLVYMPLAAGMAGLPVPMGAFVPSMLIGSLVGRLVGEVLTMASFLEPLGLSHAGVYALVGSGAMLGGFTQMTVAIVVLLVEALHDLSVVAPMMLGICISRIVSGLINHHAYDEQLILRKGVPFLEAEPEMSEADTLDALQLYQRAPLPKEALLQPTCTLRALKQALQLPMTDFPVLDGEVCIGAVTRQRLQAAVQAFDPALISNQPHSRLKEETDLKTTPITETTDREEHLDTVIAKMYEPKKGVSPCSSTYVPVQSIMDTTPFVVLADMPVSRIWALFTHGYAKKVCIMSREGKFQGLLTRLNLIEAMQELEQRHLHHHGHSHEEQSPDASNGSLSLEDSPTSAKASMTQPRRHHLPNYILWTATIFIALLLGILNFAMVSIDVQLVTWKFSTTQDVISMHGVPLGALTLAGICMVLSCGAACLVAFVAPICAGSGIPEAKSYLNANYVHGMFEPRNFFVRVLGIVLATAAGFPVGREGPMVCIGGCLGIFVTHVLGLPFLRRWVKVDATSNRMALFVEEERFRYAKRIGCVLGGAAGIATAFSAPIGAILYMLEEVTVIAWPPELTFRVFVCTVCAVLTSRFLFNISGTDIHRLVIFEQTFQGASTWQWLDIPFFVMVAAAVGLCAAGMTRAMVKVFSLRQRLRSKHEYLQLRLARVGEAALLAAFIALVFCIVPSFFSCHDGHDSHGGSHQTGKGGSPQAEKHRRLAGGSHLYYVQYTCEDGAYNEAATLLLSGAEGAVKHLFSRGEESMSMTAIFLSLLVYAPLAASMPGLSVPMGAFIPSMFIGALLGRFVGEALTLLGLGTSHAGMFSIVGSAAMLSGFTQMTLAIVVLLIEASMDLNLVGPLMLSVFVSHVVARSIHHHAYDEQLILKKGIAFLDAELPHGVDGSAIHAVDMVKPLPKVARLAPFTSVEEVVQALACEGVTEFPVIKDGHCIGLVKRKRLEVALRGRNGDVQELYDDPVAEADLWQRSYDTIVRNMLGQQFLLDDREGGGEVPVSLIMDIAPYTLLEDMPLGRLYSLFTKCGVSAACVITQQGEFSGILTKADILDCVSHGHDGHHGHQSCRSSGMKADNEAKPKESIGLDDVDILDSESLPQVLGKPTGKKVEIWADEAQVYGTGFYLSSVSTEGSRGNSTQSLWRCLGLPW